MNKKSYNKKCRTLFRKAKELSLELIFNPEIFDCRRLNCLWYGGYLAEIKVSEKLTVKLDIYGDVRAILTDKNGEIISSITDKNNDGMFSEYMLPYIKTDKQLYAALESGRLSLGNGNWVKYDGVVTTEKSANGTFIDLGIICDNILDDDILLAIEQALNSIEEIKEEISEVAENHYGIKGGII